MTISPFPGQICARCQTGSHGRRGLTIALPSEFDCLPDESM